MLLEAVGAQWHKRVTVKADSGSIATLGVVLLFIIVFIVVVALVTR